MLTPVHIAPSEEKITRHHRLMLLGSCFAENIGDKLEKFRFSVDINPFGTLYNPGSIAAALSQLLDNKPFTRNDIFKEGNLWHSFLHHSRFSHPDADTCLQHINARFSAAAESLRKTDLLILTWGTAWVYIENESGKIVANCHKLPASRFTRRRLSVEEMLQEWTPLLSRLFAINPDIKLLLTVSPIRHLKDGAHGNRLSKAALLLFCDELMQRYPDRCHYFPAYEIVLDELRDYRFYDTDMVHPSAQAIEYVWERFSETFFDKETIALHREWEALSRASQHRPLTPDKEAYRRFVEQHILRLEEFHKKYPDFSVVEELATARRIIEKSDSDEISYK